jgi:hypothetical protein
MTVGISSTNVHLRVGETSGHGRARRAGADDQHIHGIVHAGLSITRRSMPRPAPEMQCGVPLACLIFGILCDAKPTSKARCQTQPE